MSGENNNTWMDSQRALQLVVAADTAALVATIYWTYTNVSDHEKRITELEKQLEVQRRKNVALSSELRKTTERMVHIFDEHDSKLDEAANKNELSELQVQLNDILVALDEHDIHISVPELYKGKSKGIKGSMVVKPFKKLKTKKKRVESEEEFSEESISLSADVDDMYRTLSDTPKKSKHCRNK